MNIYVYENREEALNLEPISLTRPAFDLRCGAFTFLERIRQLLPQSSFGLFVRKELTDLTGERFPDSDVNPDSVTDGLWLNATVIWHRDVIDRMLSEMNTLFTCGKRLVGAYLDKKNGEEWLKKGSPVNSRPNGSLTSREISVDVVTYLWEGVMRNGSTIASDGAFFDLGSIHCVTEAVHLLNPSRIHVGEGSTIKPGAVMNAEDGPIIIGENVTILSGTYLHGPLIIGDNCLVKAGAKIYGNTTVGPGCKIGGEITASVFQSWSNKQHDGFIGHAYIGEWVNLGADTNNSDLKNNYSTIKVTVNGRVVDTGQLFVGLFLGDHSKTGINTMFNTGTSVGPASSIVGYGFPPKVIPPFSWVINGNIRTLLFEKFLETARVVKKRRGQSLSSVEEQCFRRLFDDRSTYGSS